MLLTIGPVPSNMSMEHYYKFSVRFKGSSFCFMNFTSTPGIWGGKGVYVGEKIKDLCVCSNPNTMSTVIPILTLAV